MSLPFFPTSNDSPLLNICKDATNMCSLNIYRASTSSYDQYECKVNMSSVNIEKKIMNQEAYM